MGAQQIIRDKPRATPPKLPFARGFTLMELAVVLVIVALLLGGLLMPLSAQRDLSQVADTEKILTETREALLGFAVANGRLPCPDTDLDGLENCVITGPTPNTPIAGQSTTTFSCSGSCEGWLPFATLGTTRTDAWNNRFRYSVTPAFANVTKITDTATGNVLTITPGFSLTSAGTFDIKGRGDDPTTPNPTIETKFSITLASSVPAVVISHGRNGYGAISLDGITLSAPPIVNIDETANATSGSPKWSRFRSAVASNCSDTAEGQAICEFDDLVIWLSPNILYNRMIAAGRLP